MSDLMDRLRGARNLCNGRGDYELAELFRECAVALAAHAEAEPAPELNDRDGWVYDPDKKLAEIRARMSEAPAPGLRELVGNAAKEINPTGDPEWTGYATEIILEYLSAIPALKGTSQDEGGFLPAHESGV